MNEVIIDVRSGRSRICVGSVAEYLPVLSAGRRIVTITDSTVSRLLNHLIPVGEIIQVEPGEEAKSLSVVEKIYHQLFSLQIDRQSLLIGIGGGSISDLTGFVASTFLRGIPFGFIPTTLLAQVDASIGGKNGVNYNGVKNLVGTTKQPDFCLCDPTSLKTLPKQEISCGFAEVIKHSIISKTISFDLLRDEAMNIQGLKSPLIEEVIFNSVAVKAGIVTRDEFEYGERKLLNLGHTIGHGVEVCCSIPHGQAVSIGLALEAELAAELGLCSSELVSEIKNLLKLYNLPVEIEFDPSRVMAAILHDKKRDKDSIMMPLPLSIGHCSIERIAIEKLREFLCR